MIIFLSTVIPAVTVNPGNVHDSAAFDGIYDRLVEKNPGIKAIVADAGYKTPWISKRILDDGRIPVLPYKRPMNKKGFLRLMNMYTMNILIA